MTSTQRRLAYYALFCANAVLVALSKGGFVSPLNAQLLTCGSLVVASLMHAFDSKDPAAAPASPAPPSEVPAKPEAPNAN